MSIHLFAHATTSDGDTDLRSVPQVAQGPGTNVALWLEQVDTSYDICLARLRFLLLAEIFTLG